MNSVDGNFHGVLKKHGYEGFKFMPEIRVNHIIEFYKFDDLFLKISLPNCGTKGIESEFNILKKVQHLGFTPRLVSYEKIDEFDILVIQYIHGTTLTRALYKPEYDEIIFGHLKKLYGAGIIHGDIKKENILISRSLIFLIDFDQSYEMKNTTLTNFRNSPDIVGNAGMNYINLIKELRG